ncbi:MAG: hypothetical protein IT196_26310 [Acidimicrobiales bacterium]|nr:hypothetical protein [Acidimicrobiales bacterium]
MPEATSENLAIVRALLDAAGLQPPPEEVDRLAELYGPIRRQLAMVHAADVGDVDPSNVFRAGEVGR